MRKILFTLTFALVAFLAHAETEIDGIYYNLNSSARTAKVTYGSKEYLGAVTIPSTVSYRGYSYLVTSIGNFAFDGCSGLTSVTIPNSVTSIGGSAFWGCSSLTSIIIPNSVTRIGSNAFCCCTGIAKFIIPNGVANIEPGTFDGCTGLADITIPNNVVSIGNYAFNGCISLTTVVIPNSVTSIGEGTFEGCTGITAVTIPNSVTSMGDYAFYGCSSLVSVTIESPTPVTIYDETFTNHANAILYVPIGSKSAYQTADFWKEFKEIIEKDMTHDAGLGDINGDGEFSIADVALLVDYLLERNTDNFILANADVNKDGDVTISDVVSIIKLILEGNTEQI